MADEEKKPDDSPPTQAEIDEAVLVKLRRIVSASSLLMFGAAQARTFLPERQRFTKEGVKEMLVLLHDSLLGLAEHCQAAIYPLDDDALSYKDVMDSADATVSSELCDLAQAVDGTLSAYRKAMYRAAEDVKAKATVVVMPFSRPGSMPQA